MKTRNKYTIEEKGENKKFENMSLNRGRGCDTSQNGCVCVCVCVVRGVLTIASWTAGKIPLTKVNRLLSFRI